MRNCRYFWFKSEGEGFNFEAASSGVARLFSTTGTA
nr:unnamed protein product [Brassica oleracea]